MPDVSRIMPTLVQTLELNIFLSSADEVLEERTQLAGLIEEINGALAASASRIRVRAQMWESLSGFRSNERVNQDIINLLLAPSSLAIVILGSHLKEGTKEELDFALAGDMELVVLALDPKRRAAAVSAALERVANAGVMYMDQRRLGLPADRLLLRSIVGRVIDLVCLERENHVERR